MKILFLCVANSARSQMAEGIARSLFGSYATIESAGSSPCGWIHPWAVEIMREVGIDIRGQSSKGVSRLPVTFLGSVDLVITLCAEEPCPIADLGKRHLLWPLADPAADPEETKPEAFRRTRNSIEAKLKRLGRDQGWL